MCAQSQYPVAVGRMVAAVGGVGNEAISRLKSFVKLSSLESLTALTFRS